MRSLSYYRGIEDQNRKDKSEGKGRAVGYSNRPVITFDQKSERFLGRTNEFGPVYVSVSSPPPYILCFSGPQVDLSHLASQYGGYVVCIRQPSKLVCDIASYLEQSPELSSEMLLECIKVRYNRGQYIGKLPKPANHEFAMMSFGQKDPKFSSDCEYRLVLTLPLTTSPPIEIKIELQKKLEYAEMVHLQTDN